MCFWGSCSGRRIGVWRCGRRDCGSSVTRSGTTAELSQNLICRWSAPRGAPPQRSPFLSGGAGPFPRSSAERSHSPVTGALGGRDCSAFPQVHRSPDRPVRASPRATPIQDKDGVTTLKAPDQGAELVLGFGDTHGLHRPTVAISFLL